MAEDLPDIPTALRQIAAQTSVAAVAERFRALLAGFGMTASAGGMLTGPRAPAVHFSNWAPGWLALYQERDFIGIDPLIRYVMVSGEAESWSAIYGRFPARDPGHVVLREAGRFGYREGFVTPVRTRDGSLGLVSVGGPRTGGFSDWERIFLEAVSAAVLRRVEAILCEQDTTAMPARLSMREREVIGLLRQGMTDQEIARTMSVSAPTVRTYIDSARQKLNARNRTQLAMIPVP